MFTGLIEHISTISNITESTSDEGFTFTLKDAAPILDDCNIGDSICINGACLTVTDFDATAEEQGGWFRVNLANETLSRTNLGTLKVGDGVNCERAMAGHTRFGGHMVQGHVDTTATILSKTPDGDSLRYNFRLDDPTLLPYLVEKGYITIDGASLTLTHVDDKSNEFGIMLIRHSQSKLTLTGKGIGEKVNIEADCVGKYVLGSADRIRGLVEKIVEEKLREKGL